MASTLAPKSSPFLALPLEIRQQIYHHCIPQNLRFKCPEFSSPKEHEIYIETRPLGWLDRRWSYFEVCDRDASGLGGDDVSDSAAYNPSNSDHDASLESIEDREEKDEYASSRLDDDLESSEKTMWWSRPSALPGLLLVNRQINNEVEAMLYGGNTFEAYGSHHGQMNFERIFGRGRREKMRKIMLILQPDPTGLSSFRLNPDIWLGILRNISILGVIIKQPRLYSSSIYLEDQEALEDASKRLLEEWETKLSLFLDIFVQALPEEAEIVVDANGMSDTIRIFDRFLPDRCYFQRFRAADDIFERGYGYDYVSSDDGQYDWFLECDWWRVD